eukprot:8122211-Pyramimonas_sp.AAC.1
MPGVEGGHAESSGAPGRAKHTPFGLSLVIIGIGGCAIGLWVSIRHMRKERCRMVHHEREPPLHQQLEQEMVNPAHLEAAVGIPGNGDVVMGIPVHAVYPPDHFQGTGGTTYASPFIVVGQETSDGEQLPRQTVTCPTCSTQTQCIVGTRHVICPGCENTRSVPCVDNPLWNEPS